ncbi:NF-X1-type zinc finger protein NFXL1 [Geodia barretti]|uniref:NF-X1-type zinc finger protein NFXL1 n=1 Tax=Geodia barretti TaxID=519541 RepID=A0AA35U0Z7_GEOBA|nr:NF-X1-type zinc finger protein NFXL1 [Geodia barretti]
MDGEVLKAAMTSAGGSCLVCLSSIKRTDAVWSCSQCYCLFHLQCIQQWARDGERQLSLLSPELFPGQEVLWSCPKCRLEHPMNLFPKTYFCFCGKHTDPPVDLWLLPHTCGEICGKPLQPECGHSCVSLCHPGPCPPCPKTLNVSCHCGRSPAMVKRCGVRGWMCGRVCGRELDCGLHSCEQRCHDGQCGECGEMIEQSCVCGRESKQLGCTAPPWQCSQVCGELLSCGCHSCQRVCHSGPCGGCPRSGTRTCPCGKTEHDIPCTEEVATCKDTCGKDLLCSQHKCMRPCHYGPCGQCLQMAVRGCRCGKKEKQVTCSSEYLCEAKCSRMRQCGRHQCRRKCCDGRCLPCEQVCGRTLGCRNHKCAAPCHVGRCYPCILTAEVSCACKTTTGVVPCGLRKTTKPPRCRQPCRKPPACHHTEGSPHNCHFGVCPPCKLVCGKIFSCGHSCLAPCHSLPTTPTVRPPGVAPWVKIEPVVTPCPPCSTLLTKACKGEHEISEQSCSSLRDYSCGRKCGRRLKCGNHTCQRGCHEVINPPDSTVAGEDCLECNRGCEVPRPPGCTHPCPRPCHTGPCEVCRVLVKVRCHCDTMNLFVECW